MTLKQRLRGVITPITTPFDPVTGDIAPLALRDNVRAVLDAGCSGVLVGGSTGEAALLSEDESHSMVGWVREVVDDDEVLMVGAGRESTRATIAVCRVAAESGADTVLIRPPCYFSPLIEPMDLVDHFTAVADGSPVPVLVYNIPKYTNLPVPAAALTALAGHPNIIGAKDSCGDLTNFAAYRDAVPDWSLLVGSGALMYGALELGAVGGVVAVANFAAEICTMVMNAFLRGNKAEAEAAQERLTPLHSEIVGRLGPAGIKRAMDAVGLTGGLVRSPLKDVEEKVADEVDSLLQSALLLTA